MGPEGSVPVPGPFRDRPALTPASPICDWISKRCAYEARQCQTVRIFIGTTRLRVEATELKKKRTDTGPSTKRDKESGLGVVFCTPVGYDLPICLEYPVAGATRIGAHCHYRG